MEHTVYRQFNKYFLLYVVGTVGDEEIARRAQDLYDIEHLGNILHRFSTFLLMY